MREKIEASDPIVVAHLSDGDQAFLKADIPAGLFESENGNRYIVSVANGFKVAIALAHSQLRPFTWLALCDESLEVGRWWGAYRLRLPHSLPGRSTPRRLGTIGTFGGSVIMDCRSVVGVKGSMTLGTSGDESLDQDYEGWIVEAIEGERLFFAHSRKRKGTLVLEVRGEGMRIRA